MLFALLVSSRACPWSARLSLLPCSPAPAPGPARLPLGGRAAGPHCRLKKTGEMAHPLAPRAPPPRDSPFGPRALLHPCAPDRQGARHGTAGAAASRACPPPCQTPQAPTPLLPLWHAATSAHCLTVRRPRLAAGRACAPPRAWLSAAQAAPRARAAAGSAVCSARRCLASVTDVPSRLAPDKRPFSPPRGPSTPPPAPAFAQGPLQPPRHAARAAGALCRKPLPEALAGDARRSREWVPRLPRETHALPLAIAAARFPPAARRRLPWPWPMIARTRPHHCTRALCGAPRAPRATCAP